MRLASAIFAALIINSDALAWQVDPIIPLQVNSGINLPEIYRAAELVNGQNALAEFRRAQAAAQRSSSAQSEEIVRLPKQLLEPQIQQEQLALERQRAENNRYAHDAARELFVGDSNERTNSQRKTCFYAFGSKTCDLMVDL